LPFFSNADGQLIAFLNISASGQQGALAFRGVEGARPLDTLGYGPGLLLVYGYQFTHSPFLVFMEGMVDC